MDDSVAMLVAQLRSANWLTDPRKRVRKLSDAARLLLYSLPDAIEGAHGFLLNDAGLITADAETLQDYCFPNRPSGRFADVARYLSELEGAGCIRIVPTREGESWFQVCVPDRRRPRVEPSPQEQSELPMLVACNGPPGQRENSTAAAAAAATALSLDAIARELVSELAQKHPHLDTAGEMRKCAKWYAKPGRNREPRTPTADDYRAWFARDRGGGGIPPPVKTPRAASGVGTSAAVDDAPRITHGSEEHKRALEMLANFRSGAG